VGVGVTEVAAVGHFTTSTSLPQALLEPALVVSPENDACQ
jgi:hypothetical protein